MGIQSQHLVVEPVEKSLARVKTEHADICDEDLIKNETDHLLDENALDSELSQEELLHTPKTVDGFIDYNQIYDELQERFNKAYLVSQKLFLTEKTQRQTLYHYKRRVNALLDVLQDIEGEDEADIDTPLVIDHSRLSLLVEWQPELKKHLGPALQIAASSEEPSNVPLKRSYAANLAIEEMVPEISNDELDAVELNPQETDMWVKRNFLHLVVSKFRPAEIRAKGVREYVDPLAFGSKRRKR